jgi:hypothetical protein
MEYGVNLGTWCTYKHRMIKALKTRLDLIQRSARKFIQKKADITHDIRLWVSN